MHFRFIYILFIAGILTACSSAPVVDSVEVQGLNDVEEAPEALTLMETTPLLRAPSHSRNAVTSIMINARAAMQKGQYKIAAAQLERAVRIEPKNALLWHNLAKVRFNQGRYSLAANLASKSTLLARGDDELRASNAILIKQAQAAFKIK